MRSNSVDQQSVFAFEAAMPPGLQALPAKNKDVPAPVAPVVPESMLAIFDDIWSKLLLLAKQLRDIMQSYNQKKQELGWDLEINTLHTKVQAINKSYVSSALSAAGSILGGSIMLGLALKGGENGALLGQSMGQTSSGIFNWSAGSETRESEQLRSVADLQDKGAQAYAKTMDETLEKARDVMQQMISLGHNLIEVLSQMLHALSR